MNHWPALATSGQREGDGFEVRFDEASALALRRELFTDPTTEWWSLQRRPEDVLASTIPAPARARRRVLCSRELMTDQRARTAVEAAIRSGVQYRVARALPLSMAVAERVAVVEFAAGGPEAVLVLRSSALLGALHEYFELRWSQALPYAERPVDETAGARPSPLHLKVLQLAGGGLKDDEIASSLRISVRSVRRYMEALEHQLGATNRFTLGVAAARRGWV